MYAVLEQIQPQQPTTTIARLNETVLTEQDQQTHWIEKESRNGSTNQTGIKSQSATWTSAQHSTVGPKPRHKNLELVQIYDNVTIEMEGRTVTGTDNGSSYPENYRKHSLPANIGGHQRSDASQEYPASNESDKNKETDDTMLIYSTPDMNKKREECHKKREQKEQEEKVASLQGVSSSSSSPPYPQLTEMSSSRQKENEPSIGTDLVAVVDSGQQKTDTDLKFGKHISEQYNQDNKVPMGKDECVYDEPISLNLVPKRSKNITQRKEKEKDGEEEI